MPYVNEFYGFSVGNKVSICGYCSNGEPFNANGKHGVITRIAIGEGAKNGWFHIISDTGCEFLLAGEEIGKINE